MILNALASSLTGREDYSMTMTILIVFLEMLSVLLDNNFFSVGFIVSSIFPTNIALLTNFCRHKLLNQTKKIVY